jgi:RNA polymerase sigma-70 factor (ECF subfamily)
VIRNAQDPSSADYRDSLEALARTYWRPVYAHFRRRWNKRHEEASDLTQDFFCALCEKEFLSHVSQEHGRFRSYVLAALDNFARLDHRWRTRQKRGGIALQIPLGVVEDYEPAGGDSAELEFERDWARAVLAEALDELAREASAEQREAEYQAFLLRDVRPPAEGPPSYESLARTLKISVSDVTNGLYRMRKKLRDLVLMRVRDTVSSDREAEAEMRELFDSRDAR